MTARGDSVTPGAQIILSAHSHDVRTSYGYWISPLRRA